MTEIVERLRGLYDKWNSPHSSPDGLPTGANVMLDAADEIKRLRAALEEIISFQVFGFAITAPEGGDVWCEGTNRFIREEAMVKVRKIARAALGGENG